MTTEATKTVPGFSERLNHALRRLAAPMHTMVVRGLEMVTSIIAAVLVARTLGAEGMGNFTLAFTIAGFLSIAMLFGSDGIAVRMYTSGQEDPQRVMGASLSILTIGSGICLVLAVILTFLLSLNEIQIAVLVLAIVTLFFNSLSSVFVMAIIAYDNSRYDVGAMVLARALQIVWLVLGLKYGGLVLAVVSYVVSSALLAAARGWIVHRTCFPLRPLMDRMVLRRMWGAGWKVGLGAVFGTISFRSDVLLLQALSTTEVIGIYGAANRVINGLSAGTAALAEALFPGVARAAAAGVQTLESKLFKIVPGLVAVGSLGCALFVSDWLVHLLYGAAFASAGPVLRFLFLFLALDALNAFYNRYLVATHREGYLPKAQALGAITNVIINLSLIPRLGATGAALGAVGSCVGVSSYYLVRGIRERMRRSG